MASSNRFKDAASAKTYLAAQQLPIVVKADGLAAGKGVIIAQTLAEAEAAIDMMFEGGLGAAGAEVVIEEFMVGEEASFFALCDGETAIPLASAQDHKRAFDHDQGPNTGGMGAYSPAPVMSAESGCQRRSKCLSSPSQEARNAGTMSDIIRSISTWHSGSPKRTLYSNSFGPCAVSITPA